MKQNTLTLNCVLGRHTNLVYAMVLPAIIGIVPLYFTMEAVVKSNIRSPLTVPLITLLYIALVGFLTYKGVRMVQAKTRVFCAPDLLEIELTGTNFFYPNRMAIHPQNIKKITQFTDKGFRFINIGLAPSVPLRGFYLRCPEEDESFEAFYTLLCGYVADSAGKPPAASEPETRNIFQKWPLKFTAYGLLPLILLLPFLPKTGMSNLTGSVSYWIAVLAVIWFVRMVYQNNSKVS